MMNFGLHLSGGPQGYLGVLRLAAKLKVTAVQFFSQSPRMWHSKAIDDTLKQQFLEEKLKTQIQIMAFHSPYLVNLAGTQQLIKKSQALLIAEAHKAAALGIQYVIFHPGSGSFEKAQASLLALLPELPSTVQLLVENSSGGGQKLATRFEEWVALIENTPCGLCLDTAHAYAAGYDLKHKPEEVLTQLGSLCDLSLVKVLHFNDSQAAQGSLKDRHADLGKGEIKEGLKKVFRDPRLSQAAFITERPPESHAHNLKYYRAWSKPPL